MWDICTCWNMSKSISQVSVQAFAIEARQPLAEDLCTEAVSSGADVGLGGASHSTRVRHVMGMSTQVGFVRGLYLVRLSFKISFFLARGPSAHRRQLGLGSLACYHACSSCGAGTDNLRRSSKEILRTGRAL